MTTQKLGIDVATSDKVRLMGRLRRLKTTIGVSDGGCYHMGKTISQVWLDTTWSEEQLEDWLYRVHHKCYYYGTFKR